MPKRPAPEYQRSERGDRTGKGEEVEPKDADLGE